MVAKTQAKSKVLDLLDISQLKDEKEAKGNNIANNNQMVDVNVALDTQYENWKEFKPAKKYHCSDSLLRNGDPSYTSSDHNSQSGAVSKVLTCCLSSSRHQKLILIFFSGDLFEYYYIMEIFKEVTEERIGDTRERLRR